jgi:hypothetical protein
MTKSAYVTNWFLVKQINWQALNWPLECRGILHDGCWYTLVVHFVWSGIKGSQQNHTARKVETNPMTVRAVSHFSNRKAERSNAAKTTSSKPTFITLCAVHICAHQPRAHSHKGHREPHLICTHAANVLAEWKCRASLKSTAGAKMDFNGFRYQNMTHKGSVSVLGVQYIEALSTSRKFIGHFGGVNFGQDFHAEFTTKSGLRYFILCVHAKDKKAGALKNLAPQRLQLGETV